MDTKPVAKIVVKGQAELLARLQEAKHCVAGNPAISAYGAAGNLSLDDETAQVVLRRISAEGDFRSLEHAQQFGLAAVRSDQQCVESVIAGAQGEDAIEPATESIDCPR